MAEEEKKATNADILTALQGMWRQQKDLIHGVEGRLTTKLVEVERRLDERLGETEQRLSNRLAQEIQDRPVVVHVDMSRVTELEKQVQELVRRVTELEARDRTH